MMPNRPETMIHGELNDLADFEAPEPLPVNDESRILVVDDDELIRLLLASGLTDLGFSVTTAENGEEAWSILQEDPIRMVLTDWDMPHLNGLGLLRRIRAMEGGESVYVIILTGRGNDHDLVVGLDAGADDFLAKPFDVEELRVRIQAGQRIVRLQQRLLEQNRRLEQDLTSASSLQRALLPGDAPNLGEYRFAWRFVPCTHVSGDMLNVFRLDERRVGFFILDVSGHGAAAAMMAVTVSRLLTPVAGQSTLVKRKLSTEPYYEVPNPAEVVASLRTRFTETERTGLFFTLVYGILDVSLGEVTWASAGHEPPILTRPGSMRIMSDQESGAIIGPDLSIPDPSQPNRLLLQPGERLWLYSDGIVDVRSPDGSFFSMSALARTFSEAHAIPIDAALDSILRRATELVGTEFQDDVTLLIVERATG
jgi:sigma-B regulation protein RsbU (phosphoserine phosphatase)